MKAWNRMTNEIPTRCRRGSACRLEKSMAWDLQMAACKATNVDEKRACPLVAGRHVKRGANRDCRGAEGRFPPAPAGLAGVPKGARSPRETGRPGDRSERVARSDGEEAPDGAGLMPRLVVVDAVRDDEVRIERG